jgi:Tol biopolymer transport system component
MARSLPSAYFSKGRNRMLVVEIPSGKVLDEVSMGKAEQFSNLSWSPDGDHVVFQALSEGQGDLYMYSFKSDKKVTQLTNDKYSDYQPSFSRDGKKVIFSSDRTTYDQNHQVRLLPLTWPNWISPVVK